MKPPPYEEVALGVEGLKVEGGGQEEEEEEGGIGMGRGGGLLKLGTWKGDAQGPVNAVVSMGPVFITG